MTLARPLGHLEKQCPVRTAINVIGGRWKPLILLSVRNAPARYSDIQRDIPAISAQALSRQLGQLTADGVLSRERAGAAASYRLTERGKRLSRIMELLENWGNDYLDWRVGVPQ